jgi:hypothetical protein
MENTKLKEVIKQILPHYEMALIEMPKEDHYGWLKARRMQNGICWFSINVLGISINGDVERVLGHKGYVNGCPISAAGYMQNLNQIQIRVDWMREYLTNN